MYRIFAQRISLDRGDSFTTTITIMKDDEVYEPASGDTVTFIMKKEYTDETPAIQKTLSNSDLVLSLDPTDTATLEPGEYHYGIKITYADGSVDTFIKNIFEVLPNV
ncbi:MAG: hypothetical protein IIZ78_12215 [Clostridiales bacterium]|nr:hypothetical protein [Clostridiales bacterium]